MENSMDVKAQNPAQDDQHGGHIVGVDIGGTFTDCIVIGPDGSVTIGKSSSTPPNFERGFLDSIRVAAESAGLTLEELMQSAAGIYHGCTVGTNALVEGRTAKVGLITTRGHRDSIFFMKGGSRLWHMPPEYIAHVGGQTKPPPLVPKQLIEEVDERVAFDGNALVALDEDGCRRSIERLAEAGVEAFAISLLWSVVNPRHEERIAELIHEALPDAFVSVGSEVIARTGEYERTVGSVINALIGPVMRDYLGTLQEELRTIGYDRKLHVMTCSGGVVEADYAMRLPVLTIDSGPVGGLIGAGALALASQDGEGEANIITIDMGGTTLDVGVLRRGVPLTRPSANFGQYEFFVPKLDVRSVGSGGGSIVHYDTEKGSLRVGPQSAGADPGPAAYGRGKEATVTDANLVLGYLNPEGILGGALSVDVAASRAALARAGEVLGYSAEQTAAAVARIVDHQMADAIRLASVQQGYDPRAHEMYAYGGGGPVHANAIARLLGVTDVVIPLSDLASGWSAFGAVSSEAVVVFEEPHAKAFPVPAAEMNSAWDRLEGKVRAAMTAQGIGEDEIAIERRVNLRYSMQVNEVAVVAPPGEYDEEAVGALSESFEQEYERLYGAGTGYAEAGFAMSAMQVQGRAKVGTYKLSARDAGGGDPEPVGHRDVIFYEKGPEPVSTPLYTGADFLTGMEISGPAIVEYTNTTLVLHEGDRAVVDPLGSVRVSVDA
jgi:N-methylhydantoinase A